VAATVTRAFSFILPAQEIFVSQIFIWSLSFPQAFFAG
jgi:hypothetical protein